MSRRDEIIEAFITHIRSRDEIGELKAIPFFRKQLGWIGTAELDGCSYADDAQQIDEALKEIADKLRELLPKGGVS